MLSMLQVLQEGGREPPTKPKGRPCKHELNNDRQNYIDDDRH